MDMRLVVVCLVVSLVVSSSARNPGLKARITKTGLNYANTMAMQALAKNIQTTTIPDESGKASGFKYTVSGMHVSQYNPPSSSINIVSNQGLQWTASGAYIRVDGNFRFKSWIVSDHGTFTATVSRVNFDLLINIGEDTSGRPSISAGKCVASVGGVDFKFHGGASWLYNIFRKTIAKKIQSKLNDIMCPEVTKAVNVDAEKRMQELPMTSTFAKRFLLDYLLTATPMFTSDYMETYHKGEVLWKDDTTSGAPISAPAMPKSGDTQNMLYLWVSDYVLDTFFFQAQKHGFLVRNVTAKDLPPESRGVLNTTCAGFTPCIGKYITAIGQKYPNSAVELRMRSTRVPDLNISTSGVTASFGGNIDLYVRVPGRTDTPFLLTLYANMSTNVNVSVGNQMLFAKISDVKFTLKAGNSSIGPVNDKFLNLLIDGALKAFIIPKINEAGAHGFPLPVLKEITFENTKITFAADTVQISTDVKYTPDTLSKLAAEESSVEENLDALGPLKFQSLRHE